jgi:phosphatidylinositol kinase/protein kinase (PI-3  family)
MGMIEIVLDAETTAKIHKEAGGGVMGALKKTPLTNWLQQHNPDPATWKMTVENFCRSTSAYCVATYVIGIGDRHNDVRSSSVWSQRLFHF